MARRLLLRVERRTERHSGNGDNDQTCVVMRHNVSSLARHGGRFNGDESLRLTRVRGVPSAGEALGFIETVRS